ncbi:MAG: SGNH/GDSL hydrolase family protein [Acetobacteraceae bacterium]|nr:SGNH/GDSL hydrolase family protein [Acetobacteraceae bacterium]
MPRFLRLLGLLACLLAGPTMAQAPPLVCDSAGGLPTGCGNIVFDGDSISAGVGSSPSQHPDVQFLKALDRPSRLTNVAVGGRPASECLRLFPSLVMPHYVPGARFNLIVFHAGDNDIAQGRDSIGTYKAFTAYVAAAHRQGWKVIVSTELPRPDFPPSREAELDNYNLSLIANLAGADVVADLGETPRLVAPQGRRESGLYAPDTVHLNDAGYGEMTHLLLEAARAVLSD